MPPPPVLDHIEKTFADQYRKEIDQEENVWRSLPFFAATLALQSAALAQFRDQLFGLTGRLAWVASVLALFVTLATVTAPVFLALAIRWAKFAYIASEPALLAYAQELEAAEQATSSPAGEDAATVLKRELVRQYAAATSNNRAINQRRVRHRTSAGMATLVSVLATILLLAACIGSPYLGPVEPRAGDAAHDQPAGAQAGGARAPAAEAGSRPGDAAADARGREGVVHPAGDDGAGRGGGAVER